MKTLLNGVSKILPNFSTFDHYHSMDSFAFLGASCPERILKMTSRTSYYLTEKQNFKDAGFYIPKTAHNEGV